MGLTLGERWVVGSSTPPPALGSHLASDCPFACLGPRCLCPRGRMVQPHAHRPLHPSPTTEGNLSPEGDHSLHASRLTLKMPPPGSLLGLQLAPGQAADMVWRWTVWMQFLGRETHRQGLACLPEASGLSPPSLSSPFLLAHPHEYATAFWDPLAV